MFKKLTSTILIFSSFSLISCDSSTPVASNSFTLSNNDVTDQAVDPDFQAIVDRFVIEANKRNVTVKLDGLDIQYGNTNGAYGLCSVSASGDKAIIISHTLRNATDELVSEIVIHELGHCVLGRDHSNDPTSIMHATAIIGQPWRTEVLDELFYN
ncbi:MAG: hypothetical protein ACSHX6_00980 [Akkermansiaceae bacterium]